MRDCVLWLQRHLRSCCYYSASSQKWSRVLEGVYNPVRPSLGLPSSVQSLCTRTAVGRQVVCFDENTPAVVSRAWCITQGHNERATSRATRVPNSEATSPPRCSPWTMVASRLHIGGQAGSWANQIIAANEAATHQPPLSHNTLARMDRAHSSV